MGLVYRTSLKNSAVHGTDALTPLSAAYGLVTKD